MPAVLPTILFDTARPPPRDSTGATKPPIAYLFQIPGHIEHLIHERQYGTMPTAATKATYELVCAADVDIDIGDIVTSITEMDEVTPWPDTSPNSVWHVRYIYVASAGILTQRTVYIERMTIQGPIYPT